MGNDVSVLDKKLEATALALPQVELTPEQKRKWMETRTKFLYDAPGFAAVMYKMMNPRCREVMAIFTNMGKGVVAATDGLYVMINPEEFFAYKLKERVFILAHEVVHAICNHPIQMFNCRRANKMSFSDGTSLPFSSDLWQVAADYVINAILASSNIGALPNEGKVNIDKWYHANKAGNATGAAGYLAQGQRAGRLSQALEGHALQRRQGQARYRRQARKPLGYRLVRSASRSWQGRGQAGRRRQAAAQRARVEDGGRRRHGERTAAGQAPRCHAGRVHGGAGAEGLLAGVHPRLGAA
jgi:hypothetical protein